MRLKPALNRFFSPKGQHEAMLDSGSPPDSFDTLMKETTAAAERFKRNPKATPDRQ